MHFTSRLLFLLVSLALVVTFLGVKGVKAKRDLAADRLSPEVRVLLYHEVSVEEKQAAYVLPATHFRSQMEYLVNEGFQAILSNEYLDHLNGRRQLPPKSVVLTFDDWTPDHFEFVRPTLNSLGLKGIFFVIVDKIKNSPEEQSKLRTLVSEGHEVGSHTLSHAFLTQSPCDKAWKCCRQGKPCSAREIYSELNQSKKILEDVLGSQISSFAWPGNFFDVTSVRRAVAAGYEAIYAVEQQVEEQGVLTNRKGTTREPSTIFRTEIDGFCSMDDFKGAVQDGRCCVKSRRKFYRYCWPQDRN